MSRGADPSSVGYGQQSIPSSRQGSGRFIRVRDNTVEFEDGAWMGGEGFESLVNEISVTAAPSRDISSGVGSATSIYIRDLQLGYSDGAVSVLFPVKDLVVEYRPNTGVRSVRMTLDKRSKFENGYLLTYASVGIPSPVYEALEKMIRPHAGNPGSVLRKARTNSGYTWIPVKVPDVRPITIWMSTESGDVEAGDIAEVFKAIQTSLVGYGTVAMRLKRGARDAHLGPNQFELAATLTSFQPVDIADVQSPPLNNQTKRVMVNASISSRLAELLAQKREEAQAEEEAEGVFDSDLDATRAQEGVPRGAGLLSASAKQPARSGVSVRGDPPVTPSAGAVGSPRR